MGAGPGVRQGRSWWAENFHKLTALWASIKASLIPPRQVAGLHWRAFFFILDDAGCKHRSSKQKFRELLPNPHLRNITQEVSVNLCRGVRRKARTGTATCALYSLEIWPSRDTICALDSKNCLILSKSTYASMICETSVVLGTHSRTYL